MLSTDDRLLNEEDPLLTREAIVEDLRLLGVPLSFSRLEKLCMVGKDRRWSATGARGP